MTSISGKFLPFIVLAIACTFISVDMFTEYVITETHVVIITTVLTPLGLGGLVNKGWNTFRGIKEAQLKHQMELSKTG